MSRSANYGIDSPAIVGGFLLIGLGSLGGALAVFYFGPRHLYVIGLLWVAGIYFVLAGSGMLWYSKFGKLRIRDQVIQQIDWSGSETVLDVGCGRGLLLIGAAHRLTTGKAVGLDRWQRDALSGNSDKAVFDNATIEAVRDRVILCGSDVRELPFDHAVFDVVVSNFVVHEVDTGADRQQMLSEMMRVLKPGGQFAIVDFIFTEHCARFLREIGVKDVERSRAGTFFGFWLGAILNFGLVRTYKVSGRKASGPPEAAVSSMHANL